jgi:hypothetical protein
MSKLSDMKIKSVKLIIIIKLRKMEFSYNLDKFMGVNEFSKPKLTEEQIK